jgi:hypothetical protein
VSVKFIPHLLTAEKENCLSVTSDFLECAEADKHYFKNSVTSFHIKNAVKIKYVGVVKMIRYNTEKQLLAIV